MASVINPDDGLLYIKGNLNVTNDLEVGGAVSFSGDLSVGGDLTVTNNISAGGKLSITDTSDIDLQVPTEGDGALNVTGGAWVGGNIYVGGTLLANGDVITLGNSGGSVTFNANINSDIVPATTDMYTIGTPTNRWMKVYTESLVLDTDPHTIEPTATEITSQSSLCYFDENSSPVVALRDVEPGTIKVFTLLSTPVIPIVVTPDTVVGFTNFTLTNAGDSITLLFTSAGWVITSLFRANVL